MTACVRAGDVEGVYEYELRRMREAVEAGESLPSKDASQVLEELGALRRRLQQPTELHLSALVDPDHPDRWVIQHPLFRSEVHSSDPADALVLAAIELRRALGDDETAGRPGPRPFRVDREEWETLAAQPGPTAEALTGAMRALEQAEKERNEARADAEDRGLLRSGRGGRTTAEWEAARRRLQRQSLEHLTAANVAGVARKWSEDGFGAAADHQLPLPVLVIATRAGRDGRPLSWCFDARRQWLALEHRVSEGFRSSQHLRLVATVVEPVRDTERSLRRLSLLLPGRDDSVAHLVGYAKAVAELFGGAVTVDQQRGAVGGGCWPLDLDSIGGLTGGAISAEDLGAWASEVDDGGWRLPWGPHWELLWLAEAPPKY
ncbi:MAG TPA: hypothetical protein VNF50_10805 [Acidimicrobiales bacterium]|nr:hypothetical protein [Acidimicrobiales bacterium]